MTTGTTQKPPTKHPSSNKFAEISPQRAKGLWTYPTPYIKTQYLVIKKLSFSFPLFQFLYLTKKKNTTFYFPHPIH